MIKTLIVSPLLFLIAAGCATPDFRGNTSSTRLTSLAYGMDEREVRRTLHANSLPIFSFNEDDIRIDCRRVFTVDTGWHYYLLWENDQLDAIVAGNGDLDLARTSAKPSAATPIPHEIGYSALRELFPEWSQEISDMDFSHRKRSYNKSQHYGTPGEWLMWSPILIPALPFTIPSIIRGNHVYAKMYSLDLGRSRKSVIGKLGTPTESLGTEGKYEVLVFTRNTIWSEGDKHTVSVGFRDDKVVWIRHFYDAYTDTWSREEEIAEKP